MGTVVLPKGLVVHVGGFPVRLDADVVAVTNTTVALVEDHIKLYSPRKEQD